MMKIMIVISIVGVILTGFIATMLAIQIAEGQYFTPFKMTPDLLDRLQIIKNEGETYIFDCPTFSDKDQFEVNMSSVWSMEFFTNFERVSCSDNTIMENLQELNEEFENLSNR